MNVYPAVIIGGPPHAGKSSLACALTQALRARRTPHYVLRAAPDGEGDWSCEAVPWIVERIRRKAAWTTGWVDEMCDAIARRTLPLIVDIGGCPTLDQERILDQCGYAILLTCDARQHKEWHDRVVGHSHTVLADLRSVLSGSSILDAHGPSGEIRGSLVFSARAQGPVFDALVDRLANLFAVSEAELLGRHTAHAMWTPADTQLVNFDTWLQRLHPDAGVSRFIPADVESVMAATPDDRPLALYGRLWGALVAALSSRRAVAWVYQAPVGWLAPTRVDLVAAASTASESLRIELHDDGRLEVTLLQARLKYANVKRISAPIAPADCDLVIDGKLPMWLVSGLANAYRACRSVRLYDARTPMG